MSFKEGNPGDCECGCVTTSYTLHPDIFYPSFRCIVSTRDNTSVHTDVVTTSRTYVDGVLTSTNQTTDRTTVVGSNQFVETIDDLPFWGQNQFSVNAVVGDVVTSSEELVSGTNPGTYTTEQTETTVRRIGTIEIQRRLVATYDVSSVIYFRPANQRLIVSSFLEHFSTRERLPETVAVYESFTSNSSPVFSLSTNPNYGRIYASAIDQAPITTAAGFDSQVASLSLQIIQDGTQNRQYPFFTPPTTSTNTVQVMFYVNVAGDSGALEDVRLHLSTDTYSRAAPLRDTAGHYYFDENGDRVRRTYMTDGDQYLIPLPSLDYDITINQRSQVLNRNRNYWWLGLEGREIKVEIVSRPGEENEVVHCVQSFTTQRAASIDSSDPIYRDGVNEWIENLNSVGQYLENNPNSTNFDFHIARSTGTFGDLLHYHQLYRVGSTPSGYNEFGRDSILSAIRFQFRSQYWALMLDETDIPAVQQNLPEPADQTVDQLFIERTSEHIEMIRGETDPPLPRGLFLRLSASDRDAFHTVIISQIDNTARTKPDTCLRSEICSGTPERNGGNLVASSVQLGSVDFGTRRAVGYRRCATGSTFSTSYAIDDWVWQVYAGRITYEALYGNRTSGSRFSRDYFRLDPVQSLALPRGGRVDVQSSISEQAESQNRVCSANVGRAHLRVISQGNFIFGFGPLSVLALTETEPLFEVYQATFGSRLNGLSIPSGTPFVLGWNDIFGPQPTPEEVFGGPIPARNPGGEPLREVLLVTGSTNTASQSFAFPLNLLDPANANLRLTGGGSFSLSKEIPPYTGTTPPSVSLDGSDYVPVVGAQDSFRIPISIDASQPSGTNSVRVQINYEFVRYDSASVQLEPGDL